VELYREKNKANPCGYCDFFRLIVMDINMITMGGHEATRKILGLRQKIFLLGDGGVNGVKILGCTAYSCNNDREVGLEAGMQGFMHKPILRKNFVQSLGELGLLGGEAGDAPRPVPGKGGL
jgi:CheY-like chemotaxis protein